MKNVPLVDRGRVVGGLPDVVTIMEKKVRFTFPGFMGVTIFWY